MAHLVEFIGIPGSGKTTMSAELCAALAAQGIDALESEFLHTAIRRRFVGRSATGTATRALPFIVRHPRFARRLLLPLITAPTRRRSIRRLMTVVHRVRLARSMRGVPVLCVPDEWALHELHLALAESRTPLTPDVAELVRSTVRLEQCSTLVVACLTDLATAVARVTSRSGSSDYDGLDSAALEPLFAHHSAMVEVSLEALELARVPVVTVDSSSASSVQSLVEAVRRFQLQPS